MQYAIMTREEFDEHKRRLDEQLRAGVELLETAHRHQVRALELVWMTTADSGAALPRLAQQTAPQAVAPAAAPPAAMAPAPPPRPVRRDAWQLLSEVENALASVADVFDRNDLCRALGYQPDRGSLYRTLQNLLDEGALTLEQRGAGRIPSRYRKSRAAAPRPVA
jgi:hypothetical protein